MAKEMKESSEMEVPSLVDLCVENVVEQFDTLVTKCSDCEEPKFIWRFLHPGCRIPPNAAITILARLQCRHIFKREHLTLFSKHYVNLHAFFLINLNLTPSMLSILRDFTLYDISVGILSGISLNDFVSTLNRSTFEWLHTLDLGDLAIGDKETKCASLTALSQLTNLQSLSITDMALNSKDLALLITPLTRLEFLDISETKVTDIRCLSELRNTLKELVMRKLRLQTRRSFDLSITDMALNSKDLALLITPLTRLEFLDISETKVTDIRCLSELRNTLKELVMRKLRLQTRRSFEWLLSTILELSELRFLDVAMFPFPLQWRLHEIEQLIGPASLPHLKHLEMCGNSFNLTISDLQTLAKNKPNLEFLGLAMWNKATLHESWEIENLSIEHPDIKICGGIHEGQIMKMLEHYETDFEIADPILDEMEWAMSVGTVYSHHFYEFLVNRMEGSRELVNIISSADIYVAWVMTQGERSQNIPRELLQRMLNCALTLIEEEELDFDDDEDTMEESDEDEDEEEEDVDDDDDEEEEEEAGEVELGDGEGTGNETVNTEDVNGIYGNDDNNDDSGGEEGAGDGGDEGEEGEG
ncbi:unnamed protein product, partial [Rodentolepis nana]|uniref:Disease resistance protein n=1 Tax=Rodentolepis nana TaxID=102285 RepID=A0A0R3TYP7_RODNA